MRDNSGRTEIITFPVNQSIAVSDIRCNHRLMRRIAFQNGQRLSLTYAGQNGHIHSSKIIADIDSSGKNNIRDFHIRDKLETLLGIFPVFFPWSHNPEFQTVIFFFRKTKCLNHRFDIFNRGHTQYRTDVDFSFIFFRFPRNILQIFHTDSVWRDHGFFDRAAKFDLQFPCMFKQ